MFVQSLTPAPHCKGDFSYSAVNGVPRASGCYVLASYDDIVLYIGQSQDVQRRFGDHLDDGRKRKPTPHGKIFWFYYLLCPQKDMNGIERGWVHQFQAGEGALPYFNAVSPPV